MQAARVSGDPDRVDGSHKHTAATRPWMGGRDGRAVHRARVRRHSRPPAQRAHTHRITRATAARARTSVKHWPLHAARMRASAGCRTASARSARRPPRAPDMRGDMGLGDPQPSSATPDDCARRSCVRTAAPAPATRADATRLIAHRRCGCAPHRVAARQTMRDLAGADWCFDRRRQTPNPNRIESAALIQSLSVCARRRRGIRRCAAGTRRVVPPGVVGRGRGTLRFRTSSKRWPRGRCLSCTSTTTSSRHTTCWRGYACGRPSLGWRDAAMGVSDAPQVRLVV